MKDKAWCKEQRRNFADPCLGPQLHRCFWTGQSIVHLRDIQSLTCFSHLCKVQDSVSSWTVLGQRYGTFFQRFRPSPKHFFLFRSAITNNCNKYTFSTALETCAAFFPTCSHCVWHCSLVPYGWCLDTTTVNISTSLMPWKQSLSY